MASPNHAHTRACCFCSALQKCARVQIKTEWLWSKFWLSSKCVLQINSGSIPSKETNAVLHGELKLVYEISLTWEQLPHFFKKPHMRAFRGSIALLLHGDLGPPTGQVPATQRKWHRAHLGCAPTIPTRRHRVAFPRKPIHFNAIRPLVCANFTDNVTIGWCEGRIPCTPCFKLIWDASFNLHKSEPVSSIAGWQAVMNFVRTAYSWFTSLFFGHIFCHSILISEWIHTNRESGELSLLLFERKKCVFKEPFLSVWSRRVLPHAECNHHLSVCGHV